MDVIDTDRPHQTDTPHVVPAGHVQVESAVAAAQLGGPIDGSSGDRSAHLVFFEDMYKLGVAPRIDVQLLFKHAEYAVGPRRAAAPGPYSVRAKLNVARRRVDRDAFSRILDPEVIRSPSRPPQRGRER